MPSWVPTLGCKETTPRWACSPARLSAMVFPSKPMCPLIQATAVSPCRARRWRCSSDSMSDLGGGPLESCRVVWIAVVESERTHTFCDLGARATANAKPFLSSSATEARLPRKAPWLCPEVWAPAPTCECLPEPSE